jgi:hypothetical protein
MQISAQTLLASQQAAQIQPARPVPAPGFTAALEKTEGFAPLPLRQTAPAQNPANPAPSGGAASMARPGSLIDIKI